MRGTPNHRVGGKRSQCWRRQTQKRSASNMFSIRESSYRSVRQL